MDSDFVVAVVWGVILTLAVEIVGVLLWIYSLEAPPRPPRLVTSPITRARSPERVNAIHDQINSVPSDEQNADATTRGKKESCDWFNTITDFLFQELRDTAKIKKLLARQIDKEFTELLLTKTQGKMIDKLAVREYDMGESLPVFSDLHITKCEKSEDGHDSKIELIEIEMGVAYDGGFQLAIDADLVFNKAAYVSIQIKKLAGYGRFQLSQAPVTNWSFAFLEEPYVDMDVSARFEGRTLPHLTDFIETLIRKWIKKQHVLPHYKARYKPFFQKPRPQDQLSDIHVHNESIANGDLTVEVVECGRLALVDVAFGVYCTLSVDPAPQNLQVSVWKKTWPIHELTINLEYRMQKLGIDFESFQYDDEHRSNLVIVTKVMSNSPASIGGVVKGDIVIRIDNIVITNVSQAKRIIKKFDGLKLLITIQRPIVKLLNILKKRSTHTQLRSHTIGSKSRSNTYAYGASPKNEDFEVLTISTPGATRDDMSLKSDTLRLGDNSEVGLDTHSLGDLDAGDRVDEHRPLEVHSYTYTRATSVPACTTPQHTSTCPDCISTKTVAATKNPVFDEEFNFSVTPSDKYLNISVLCGLQGENSGLMIGHVTISLTDIAVECLSSASGQHLQRYVLVPAQQNKPGTSRATLKATSGSTELPATAKVEKMLTSRKFVGDILLRFVHTHCSKPKKGIHRTPSESDDFLQQSGDSDPTSKFSELHPFIAKEGTEPRLHSFEDSKKAEICHVCRKKIWKGGYHCKRCSIFTHKNSKCTNYCRRMVRCIPKEPTGEETARDSGTSREEEDSHQLWDQPLEEQCYSTSSSKTMAPTIEVDSEVYQRTKHELAKSAFVPMADFEDSYEKVNTPTPPPSHSNSDTEDSDGEMKEEVDGTAEEELASRRAELEDKIVQAQRHLEMLSEDRWIVNENSLSAKLKDPEDYKYELQRLDAQIETTEAILQRCKDELRNSL